MAEGLICVTGGTGFLGRHLVPHLLAEGYRVRALVRPTSQVKWLRALGVELAQGDVREPENVAEAMRDCRYVVHAAGHFRFWGPREVFRAVNNRGTENVAQAALEAGVERMLYVSTVAVVGKPPPEKPITEATRCQPQDAYQRSKLAAERTLLKMGGERGLPAAILRPGAFYGPRGRYGFNRLFIEEPLRGWRVQVDGGERLTFPASVPDVARAICAALGRAGAGEIYNISDHSVRHKEINAIVSELLGISPKRWKLPRSAVIALAASMELAAIVTKKEPFYPLNLRHYVFNDWQVDSSKARAELGFEPTPLREGLRRTVEWYVANAGRLPP